MVSRLVLDKKKPVQGLPACALWPVDLKLTHVDCSSDPMLVHFQGHHLTICELDFNILQLEIQNAPKTRWVGEVGELCLVEDVLSDRWYRGRVQNKQKDTLDVFLIDHGNVLSVNQSHLALGSDEIFMLPPKIVCGFFANVLPLGGSWNAQSERYFSSLVGSSVKGYVQALLPHKVLILEAPDVNKDLNRMGFGRHVDTNTFLLLVEMLTEVPLKPSREPVPDLLLDKPTGQEFFFKPSGLQGFEDIVPFCSPKLTAGEKVKVRITAAVSPATFYCQLTSMAEDLQLMSEELAASCENKSKYSTQKTLENLGLLCSVRGKDEKWHRGFVQFLPVNSRVRVLFVDYGFCESVKVEHVLQIPTRFLSKSIMAFPCALSCLEKDDEAGKTEQLSLLKKGLLGDDLEAHIDSFDEENNIFSVTMFSTESDIITHEEPVQDVTDHKNSVMDFETTSTEMLDSVKAEEMAEDFVFEGYVEYVLNPSQFWMRTAKRNSEFEAMMDYLDKHFSQMKLDEDILANPVPGTICCAMYEKDMHYYRAIVIDTLKHGAEVFFMDFGNTEKVPHMLIKIIPEKLASVPAFALSCSLVNVMPFDDDLWTTTTTNYFRHTARNKAFLVHVVHVHKGRFVVNLFETGNQNHMSISELLTKTNHATFWKYTPSGPAESAVISKRNNRKVKLREIEPVLGKEASSTPTRNICEETAQVTDTITAAKKKSTSSFKTLTLRPGSELAIRCSHISSPSSFWCQIKDKIPVLDRLMDELQKVYETHATPLQPGDSCCMVKYKRDGRWYRACIIGKSMKKDDYEVICVDYGFTLRGKLHLLKAILPSHLGIEEQAFRCSLFNIIEPADADSDNWFPEAQVLLKDFMQGQSLICSIRFQLYLKNHGLYNIVDVLSGNHSAAKTLVELGLTKEVKTFVKLDPAIVPYSFVHSSFNLNTGSVEQVYTTHVVSPWEMYCQLERNTDILEDLMERVSQESEKIQSHKTKAVNCKLCLAKYYGDGRWYRGMVRPVPQSSLVNVFFVDYGNINMVEKSNVISIPTESADLLFTPMQALRCSLAHIPKEEDFIVVHQWLEKSVLNQPLRAVVVGKTEDGTFEIELFDGDIHVNEKVKELIASQVPKSEKKVVCFETDSTQKNMNGKNQKPLTKTAVCLKSPCGKKKSSSKSTASKSADRKQQPWGTETSCLKCETSPRGDQHDANSPSTKPLHTVELPTLSSLPKDKITAGFRGLGFISHANHVSSFFIQRQEDESSILKMGEDLNSERLKDTLKNNSAELKINDLVVAEYEEDGALYRAVVKDFEASNQYKLEFIDYGNTAVMSKEKTYCMTSAWLSQPRLSIPCTLLDSSCFDSDRLFIDAVMGKPLMVEFVSCFGIQWEVNIEIMGQVDKPTLLEWPEAVGSKVIQSKDELLAVTDENKSHPSPSLPWPSMEKFTFKARSEEIVLKVRHRAYATERLRKTRRQRHRRKTKTYKTDRETVSEGVSSETDRDRETVSEGVSSETDRDRETVSEGVSSETDRETVSEGVSSETDRDRETVSEGVSSETDRETVSEGVSSETDRDRETVSEGVSSETDRETVSEGVSSKTDSSPHQRLSLAPVNTDQTYFGFAAAVTTPYDFYIVLEDLLLNMNTVSTILKELPSDLPSLPEADLNPLTCCLVRCDTKWCRAEVVHTDRDTTVVVNLVDYGLCVDIPYQEHSMLKRLPEPLTRLPKLTYPCSLRGVKPATDEWTDEANLFFQESVCKQNLEIHFRQWVSEDRLEVDLLMAGTYVAKELVDTGHASYIDAMLGLRFQERNPVKIPPGLGLAEGGVAPHQSSALDRPESPLNESGVNSHEARESNQLLSMMDENDNAEGCPSSNKTTHEESQSNRLSVTLEDDQKERMTFSSLSQTRQCSLM